MDITKYRVVFLRDSPLGVGRMNNEDYRDGKQRMDVGLTIKGTGMGTSMVGMERI